MAKKILRIGLLLWLFFLPFSSFAESLAYNYLIELGEKYFEAGRYPEAFSYFRDAYIIIPTEEALSYINLLKRMEEGRFREISPVTKEISPAVKPHEGPYPVLPPPQAVPSPIFSESQREVSYSNQPQPELEVFYPHAQPASPAARKDIIGGTLDSYQRGALIRIEKQREPVPEMTREEPAEFPSREEPLPMYQPSYVAGSPQIPSTPMLQGSLRQGDELVLSGTPSSMQEKTDIEIEQGKFLDIEGMNITRFLIVTPGFITVEKVDTNTIRIIALKVGTTFVHVWDERGRWTLNVEVAYPLQIARALQKKDQVKQENNDPFRFIYNADWDSYYIGTQLDSMNRDALRFNQWLGIEGPTPYGEFDSSLKLSKYPTSTEIIGYSVGLRNLHLGPLGEVNVRGFDFDKSFSALSLPNEGLHGFLWEGKAFGGNLGYDVLWGRDRLEFGYLTPGIIQEERDSYVEGARATLFPDGKHTYSFNYARGYGTAREDYLRPRVFSVETEHRYGKNQLWGEVGYDEENYASLAGYQFLGQDFQLRLNLRDIDSDYTTIVGTPSNLGEAGGILSFDWRGGDLFLSSNLDVYRDRYLSNPGAPRAINTEWNTFATYTLDDTSSWNTNLRYINIPGISFPRREINLSNTYNKSFSVFNRTFSTFVGHRYQRTRYPLGVFSNYDRQEFFTGVRFPIIDPLDAYVNYEHSLVEDIFTDEKYDPSVLSVGISYYKNVTPAVTFKWNLYYRDEQNTSGINSFLAGEDSMDCALGINYRPNPDLEIYADGRVRNVWAEQAGRDAYNEAEIRLGIRSAWDLPFSWNPKGIASGIVYKDINANGIHDRNEEGISGIKIYIGNKETETDSEGRYYVKVNAKKVLMMVDVDSVPHGYVFSTPLSQTVELLHNRPVTVDFGFTTNSEIYGVVFFDKNGNNEPDDNDEYIGRVKIVLDGSLTTSSDSNGGYFFRNLEAGRHTVKLDINSLPIEYLPLVKLVSEIDLAEGTTYIFNIPLKKKESTSQ
ncbi:MAG: pilus assembly protein N-terminal domain-containing protein [Candidatus Omnitrophica bacterium]|nr:pilus assembly protein N-terminal domain-containing protein [Candidatus Omnitrophota bacterium]